MTQQYKRKATLLVVQGENALDLSDFHFTFSTVQQDVESPNNCAIRVYNLKDSTVQRIQGEFSEVVVQAGYVGAFGVVFKGTIKQFRIGKENGTDTYLDILAADGDEAYIKALLSESVASGWTQQQVANRAIQSMGQYGVQPGNTSGLAALGGTIPAPRGKVLFGMSRALLRNASRNVLSTWNIKDGRVNVIPVDGYLPGEVVVLNATTGLIGRPEQTNDGIRVKCLLNPKISIGGLVQVDNKSINQTVQQRNNQPFRVYNSRTALQFLATTAADGLYRVFVAEHEGDTRGTNWYTNLTCLALNAATKKVTPL